MKVEENVDIKVKGNDKMEIELKVEIIVKVEMYMEEKVKV